MPNTPEQILTDLLNQIGLRNLLAELSHACSATADKIEATWAEPQLSTAYWQTQAAMLAKVCQQV